MEALMQPQQQQRYYNLPVRLQQSKCMSVSVHQANRHFEFVMQLAYHDIMSLHLCLLTGQFFTFQL